MSETPQQLVQFPPEIQQQINILNARIQSLNLTTNDLLREVDNTFRTMAATIAGLQKENAELRAKLESN